MNKLDVTVTLIPTCEDFQILDIFMGSGRIRPAAISSLNLPQGIYPDKGIIVNGRAPIWLYARLVQLCQSATWISLQVPGFELISPSETTS